MVESLDENIGRLLAALEAARPENTLVIFTSDNGGLATTEGSPTCNAPLAEGKGWMYEGGTREPLMVRWPGVVESGGASVRRNAGDQPGLLPHPAGCSRPAPCRSSTVDGVSFDALADRDSVPAARPIFWHYPHYGNQGGTPGSSVRDGDYKLIEFFEDGRLELYNLRDDISERVNLAEREPTKAAELHGLLCAWRASVEAKIPQPNPHHRSCRP